MRFVEEQVAMLSQVASHTMSFANGSQKMKPSDRKSDQVEAMERMRNKPPHKRVKLIRANDDKGGLDGCDGD
jgi:hypothetical protein